MNDDSETIEKLREGLRGLRNDIANCVAAMTEPYSMSPLVAARINEIASQIDTYKRAIKAMQDEEQTR